MSIRAISWVLEHSCATHGARLVLIVLADHADRSGANTWPSVEAIARRARLSRRATQKALAALERDGEIECTRTTRHGTRVWRIVGMGGEESAPLGGDQSAPPQSRRDETSALGRCNPFTWGAKNGTPAGEDSAPKPSLTVREPTREPSSVHEPAFAAEVVNTLRAEEIARELRDLLPLSGGVQAIEAVLREHPRVERHHIVEAIEHGQDADDELLDGAEALAAVMGQARGAA